ncbi:hypothetical protein BB559_002969 [Furculomyces boomerangus]|nr:hypothetical protein BB559_002969 [Furculomyces boomerangus]
MANIELEGQGPWNVKYLVQHWIDPMKTNKSPDFEESYTSVVFGRETSTIKLNSTIPGLYKYKLIEVSDQLYKEPLLIQHASLRPTELKHIVYPKPEGSLFLYSSQGEKIVAKSENKNDGLRSLASSSPIQLCIPRGAPISNDDEWRNLYAEHAPKIQIEVKKQPGLLPPFTAWVELSSLNSPSKVIEIPNINDFTQSISLSEYLVAQTGRFKLRLLRIMDSNKCLYSKATRGNQIVEAGIEIEYVEAPTISPSLQSANSNINGRNVQDRYSSSQNDNIVSRDVINKNVCKGDILSFDIVGFPTWSVHYTYNDRVHKNELTKPVFRKRMTSPGNFSINRVCHQIANTCCANINNLNYVVHPLPSVKVGGGQSVQQSIRQGEQVQVKFELKGEPPFTFTWQRRSLAPAGSSGHRAMGKVLETHTVQDLYDHVYTLSTSMEGVFQVTYIQDKFCHYPNANNV